LALSQAPPVLLAEIATWTPLIKAPGKSPKMKRGPRKNPQITGVPMTKTPGAAISLKEDWVEILMQAL
jgi:hypothetical protein